MGSSIMRVVFICGVALVAGAAFLVVAFAERAGAQDLNPDPATDCPALYGGAICDASDALERGDLSNPVAPTRGNIETDAGTCESIGQRELESGVCAPYIDGVPPANGVAYEPDELRAIGSMDMGDKVEEGTVSPEMWEALKASGYRGKPGDGTDSVIYAPGDPRNGTYPAGKELPKTGGMSPHGLRFLGLTMLGTFGAGIFLTMIVVGRR